MSFNMTGLLGQVISRQDQIHRQDIKLDYLIQKQNFFEQKLSEMLTRLDQEKIFMRDQLAEAQNDILGRLRDIQTQAHTVLQVTPSSVSDTNEFAPHNHDSGDVINQVKDKLDILEQKTDSMKIQIVETRQTCQRLFSSTRKIENLLESLVHTTEALRTSLANIVSIPDMVRGHTRAELAWLSEHIDQRLSYVEIITKEQPLNNESLSHRSEDLQSSIDEVNKSIINTEILLDKSADKILAESVNGMTDVEELMNVTRSEVKRELQAISDVVVPQCDKINTDLESYHETVTTAIGTVKDDLLIHLSGSEISQASDLRKLKVEVEQINASVTSLVGKLDKVEKNMATVVEKIESVDTSVNVGLKTVRDDFLAPKEREADLTTQVVQLTKETLVYNLPKVALAVEILALISSSKEIAWDKISESIYCIQYVAVHCDIELKKGFAWSQLMHHYSFLRIDLKSKAISKSLMTEMTKSTDVDLLLIGKAGTGKSATGNSILKRRAFKSKVGTVSVTFDVAYEVSEFNGRIIKVVDGPGVGDTRMNTERAVNLVLGTMEYAIAANPRGYHAFLLIVRYGVRFTKEDQDTIGVLKKVFGEDVVKRYCILVLTCGDTFKVDSEETGHSFKEWCDEQEGVFKDLLNECDNRIILFDNTTRDVDKKNQQITSLLQIVDNLSSHGNRYTDENFMKAKEARDRIIVEAQIPFIQGETLKQTRLMLQKLQEVQLNEDPENKIQPLEHLHIRADALFNTVTIQDRGTGALHALLSAVKSIKKSVDDEIGIFYRLKGERERIKKHEEETRRLYEEKMRKQKEEYKK